MNLSISKEDLDHILKYTDFQKYRNKKIFITGGTGFFGKWLLESLCYANDKLALNCQVLALSRNPKKFLDANVHFKQYDNLGFRKGDILDFEFPKEKFDFIIHGATEANVTMNVDNPSLMLDTIVDGTKRILEFSKISGISRLLFLSSGAVYGKRYFSEGPVAEENVSAPATSDPAAAYGEGKRIAELLCFIHCRNTHIDLSIARCFAFFGPHLPLDSHFAFGNFIKNILSGENILIKGDGSPYRSYMYAADLAIWLFTILTEAKSGSVYNVGSDVPISIGDLAEKISMHAEQPLSVEIAKKKDPSSDPEIYVPLVEKAKRELSLNVFINLEEGIKKTLEWQKKRN
ncbi:NAD-dependent epimerase/dehydratase family protein [Leptospira ilyithenensis]|uniref:NAD(P)-dependent oxidoreductase n=1 Tax=Leptospira ilyithenensis TaxID=2484901 RepID=A0A4R9LPD4_9LEPT|nr:NAD(P)-dependent oxidoreductase [Leptospira ilyithenensis]TGN08031.1 NAD(P)-dependent oxidoreductase [Leptospira ilyithenensis]